MLYPRTPGPPMRSASRGCADCRFTAGADRVEIFARCRRRAGSPLSLRRVSFRGSGRPGRYRTELPSAGSMDRTPVHPPDGGGVRPAQPHRPPGRPGMLGQAGVRPAQPHRPPGRPGMLGQAGVRPAQPHRPPGRPGMLGSAAGPYLARSSLVLHGDAPPPPTDRFRYSAPRPTRHALVPPRKYPRHWPTSDSNTPRPVQPALRPL
jgi:hypothetical protein